MADPPEQPKIQHQSNCLHTFTSEQVKARAYQLWQQRGDESSAEDNWNDAIRQLTREKQLKQLLTPIRRLWWWTGLGSPAQRLWQWTGLSEKKGWDFLQLLIAPIVLAAIGLGLQEYVKQRDQTVADAKVKQDQKVADDKAKQDRQIADDKVKQDTLVAYLNQMAESLNSGLLQAKPSSDKFIIAQSRTVLALQSLDRKRQHLVIQFLRASGLSYVSNQTQPDQVGSIKLQDGDRVLLHQAQMSKANLANSDLSGAVLLSVNLEGANLGCIPPDSKDPSLCSDLSTADLRAANLYGAFLRAANLSGADLRDVILRAANLRDANLSAANLYRADLGNANLSGANLGSIAYRGGVLHPIVVGSDVPSSTRMYISAFGSTHGANLIEANLNDANLSGASLHDATLFDTNFSGAILLATDLRNTQGFNPHPQQRQAGGETRPLLCNVALPEGLPNKDQLKDRDCDRIPQELVKRYPEEFLSLDNAKQYVDQARQKQW